MKKWHGGLGTLSLLGLLFAGTVNAAAVNCTIAPAYTIIAQGQTVNLTASCDAPLASVNWKLGGASVTGNVTLNQAGIAPVSFTTPITLGAGAASDVSNEFTVASGNPDDTTTSNIALVVVKPASALGAGAAAAAAGSLSTPVNGACGSANGQAVTAMPTGAAQCSTGRAALAVTGASAYTWTCASLNGGTDESCYATRGYNVTAVVSGGNGSITSTNPLGVATGSTGTITVEPINSSYSPSFSSGCGGSASGNSFTTGPVSGPCTVTVTFSNNVPGNCGSYTNNVKTLTPMSAGVCSSSAAATGFSENSTTGQYSWTCPGIGSGAAASCSARLYYTVTATDNGSANGDITSAASVDVAKGTTTTVTASANATYVAQLSGCNGTPSGSPYVTGAITSNCTVTATFAQSQSPSSDPGIGTGLWLPPNTTNRFVADQSGSSANVISYVPGCLNGGAYPTSSSSGCAAQTSYTGTASGMATTTTVTMGSGNVLSLRYMSKSTAGSALKWFKMDSGDGGNVGQLVKMWLSTSPTATYDGTDMKCKQTSTTHPLVITGGSYCPMTPNTLYYLHIGVDGACSGCRYQVQERDADVL